MITAVIPVKKNSSRCNNKNIRDFSDSNLLKKKIELLKMVKNIDKILVSSDCDIMLSIARDFNVLIHKRTKDMCDSTVSGSDLYISLANEIDTEHMLLTFCVTPFVKKETYENSINIYKSNLKNNSYDSISTSLNFKHYIWHNNQPINYEYDNAPPTQLLPDYYIPTYGINIISKQFVIDNKNVIGKKPYFYNVDQIEAIDIDTPYDFLLSELLYNNHIINCGIAKNILKYRDSNEIKLIDCTYINSNFKNINECYQAVSLSKFNYLEVNDINDIKLLNDYDGCYILANLDKNINLNNIDLAKLNSIKYKINNIDEVKEITNFYINNINFLHNIEIFIFISFSYLITYNDINILYKNIKDFNIKGIIIEDNGLLNEKNILLILHNLYNKFNDKKICFGIQSPNIQLNNLAIFHGCNLITSSIGGIGKITNNLKSEEILYNLYLKNKYDISNVVHILKYYNKYIESKENYIKNNNRKYHPYYILSSINSITNEKIYNILSDNTTINDDIKILI